MKEIDVNDGRPYPGDRVSVDRGNYVVILSRDVEMHLFSCPVCSSVLVSDVDVDSMDRYSCCENCYRIWVMTDVKRWLGGWRPDVEQVASMSRVVLRTKVDL